ncbi:hypothetical protein HPB50_011179 [Hyalomma asiaticum]|uniref:Uncharacterized protein n=1 Tax=Hyalomma asiaticum TaxID=266040 RepID=A0ACB7RN27_HYAAI|nr:hypothetical protein HPB50_011179 [Hyalomma asiaticum]
MVSVATRKGGRKEIQVFDAGEAFQIVQVQECSDDERSDSAVPDETMDTAAGQQGTGKDEATVCSVKVVVTREEGIQCQDSEQ